MSRVPRHRLFWAVLVPFLLSGCSEAERDYKTIAGPESDLLNENVRGVVVVSGRDSETQEISGLFGVSLQDGKEFLIRERKGDIDFGTVGGPDSDCRLVYTEGNQFSITLAGRVCLKRIGIDGKNDEEILCREGEPNKVIGDSLTLSRDGRRVAFISGLQPSNMPGAYLERGTLEIWDLQSREPLDPELKAIATTKPTLVWLEDNRLLFVDFVSSSSLPEPPAREDLGQYASWTLLPAVHLLDLDTRQSRFLRLGWNPVAAEDGKSVLMDGLDGKVWRVDVETGESRRVTWPGWSTADQLALLDGDRVLYRGLPTSGTPPRFTKYGSFKAGTRMMSLKLARLDSKEFQTVMPYVDWRHELSFGVCRDR